MRTRNFVYALSLLACMTSSVLAKDMNLPVVSKGFQHEFWQTVKMGTEAAAKELGDKTSYVARRMKLKLLSRFSWLKTRWRKNLMGYYWPR